MPLATDPKDHSNTDPQDHSNSARPGDGSLSFFRRTEKAKPEPAPGLTAGRIVGDFRLLSLIGQGGMGQVWEAEQLSLGNRPVAVKFVRPERITERQLELFAREARAGGRLHHPGIVTIHGFGQSDGLAWIAMELVSGAWTLRDFLDEAARGETVSEGYDAHIARLVAEIAEAMHAAHEAGVIHRDLKPQNVLITSDDRPKVTDFGLARLTDEVALSQTGDFAGTYFYMSPEQVAARRAGIDHRSDVFSLGIVLYELLALRRPFQGDTEHQVAAQILAKDPPDPRTIRSKIPRDLAVIVGKALEKDRDKRFQTMKDFAADLRRHLAHEPIHAKPPTPLDRAVKWLQRNPGKSSAAAIVTVTFTLIALLLAANVRANRKLDLSNAALERKTNESEGRRKDAEQRADEVLRLSAFQRLADLEAEAHRLWPAEPRHIPDYTRWLERARELVASLDPSHGSPGHRAQLAKLRERANLPSAEERGARRRAHPRFGELERQEEKVAALRIARDVREKKAEPATVTLDPSKLPADADGLEALARALVDPDRDEFGREAEGLALARLAIERVEDDTLAARAGETLAWALLANGLDELARQESAAALEAALAKEKGDYEERAAALDAALKAARDGSALAAAERGLAALEAEVSAGQEFRFASEEDTWWHAQLEKLVAAIEAFADPASGLIDGVSEQHGWGIERRRAFAASISDRSIEGAEAARPWEEAVASIANPRECPLYGGLRISPQLGLLPIGRDPESRLWEFAHLETGEPAERGLNGKLTLTEQTGLVFVLLPGGTFTMGAQRTDPKGPNYDPDAQSEEGPPHAVRLPPFFLSKYEMTQGQWLWFTGSNPSRDNPQTYTRSWNAAGNPGDLLHPVEQVSWNDCTAVLERMGLELPHEAQWEYGARAGTTTVWWCGNEMESIAKAGNLADCYAKEHGGSTWGVWEEWNDGNVSHARVGSYLANAFGLHDVIGNVWEWCQDLHAPKRGERQVGAGSAGRVARGGGFFVLAVRARSAFRFAAAPSDADPNLGVRPARALLAP